MPSAMSAASSCFCSCPGAPTPNATAMIAAATSTSESEHNRIECLLVMNAVYSAFHEPSQAENPTTRGPAFPAHLLSALLIQLPFSSSNGDLNFYTEPLRLSVWQAQARCRRDPQLYERL